MSAHILHWLPPADGIDPFIVPQRVLPSGAQIPAIGMGTFGSDHAPHQMVAAAVKSAAEIGYRHFDCASVYGNENRIGESFHALSEEGLRRDEIWVTSKLWNDKHGEQDVIASCEKSLADLGLEYLHLYLVH
jgi:alcohol dehydrogenase (NADP+)